MVQEKPEVKINVDMHELDTVDPKLKYYCVKVSTDKAEWPETYGSKEQVDAFIRGAQAMASILGRVDIASMPVSAIARRG